MKYEIEEVTDLPKVLKAIRTERRMSKWRMDRILGWQKNYKELERKIEKNGPTLKRLLLVLGALRAKIVIQLEP